MKRIGEEEPWLQSSSEKVSARQAVGPEQSCLSEGSPVRQEGLHSAIAGSSLGMNAEADPEVQPQGLSANHTAHIRFSIKRNRSRHLVAASIMLQKEGPQRREECRKGMFGHYCEDIKLCLCK